MASDEVNYVNGLPDNNDLLHDTSANDIVRGFSGFDQYFGGKGNDTFVWHRGDGRSKILNNDVDIERSDTLAFGPSVIPNDVLVARGRFNKTDLIFYIDRTHVTVSRYFEGRNREIDGVRFADGTYWDQDAIHTILGSGGLPTNAPPKLPDTPWLEVDENSSRVASFEVTSGSTPIEYAIVGEDARWLTIDSTGDLSFSRPADFEQPQDADGDNGYELEVRASNAYGQDTVSLTIRVLDIDEQEQPSRSVVANIKASRIKCASPCPVVFSAEDTMAAGMDEHAIWSQLSYYWDFDTHVSDTYGHLYSPTYENADGDTWREVGHVPMVTKTFLCDVGRCDYRVGLRAQDSDGNYGDAFLTVSVDSESNRWTSAQTVCVSHSLDLSSDWTQFDKACPLGALKTNTMLDADDYKNKLVLLKRGDIWEQNIATQMSEDNFKIGYFGNNDEAKPRITGIYWHGTSPKLSGPLNAPYGVVSFSETDADVERLGWPEDNTLEGLSLGSVSLGMSYQHATLHDIDLDQESEQKYGSITLSRGHLKCYNNHSPHRFYWRHGTLDCANVPFPKGAYLSQVRSVSGYGNGTTPYSALNVASIGCGMTNWTGIVDSYFRKAKEHNLRVMGWNRFSIMRNTFAGEHYLPSKQKLSTRICTGGDDWLNFESWKPEHYDLDPEGRTRADSYANDGSNNYVHVSRYQVTNGNRIGVSGVLGSHQGGPKYQTNVRRGLGFEHLVQDIIVTQNTFTDDGTHTSDINAPGYWLSCIENKYSGSGADSCFPFNPAPELNMRREPTPVPVPLAPGSE